MVNLRVVTAFACLAVFSVTAASAADEVSKTFSAKILVNELAPLQKCTLITPVQETQLHRRVQSPADIYEERTVRHNRNNVNEFEKYPRDATNQVFIEIFGASRGTVDRVLQAHCPSGFVESGPVVSTENISTEAASQITATAPIIKKIVDSGDPKNRIDIVFMGDGYTAAEETKFFADIQRLTDEMFTGDTFAQYLPLFNVWAVLQPSAVSGIGSGGTPKNTAFGLYRGRSNCILCTCMRPLVLDKANSVI